MQLSHPCTSDITGESRRRNFARKLPSSNCAPLRLHLAPTCTIAPNRPFRPLVSVADMLRTAISRSASPLELRAAACSKASVPTARTAQRTFVTVRQTPSRLSIASRPAFQNTSVRTFANTSRMAANTRTESDAFGNIEVPSDKYWGAQTERSLENFKINQPQDRMPPPIVRAFGILKGAAATVNMKFGLGRTLNGHEWRRHANGRDAQTPSSARLSSKLLLRLRMASSWTTSRWSCGRLDPARNRT